MDHCLSPLLFPSTPPLQVNHVVSFDFPSSLPDYLHRVGRTGRVGTVATKCRATTFMSHRRDVVLAWKVKVGSVNLVVREPFPVWIWNVHV